MVHELSSNRKELYNLLGVRVGKLHHTELTLTRVPYCVVCTFDGDGVAQQKMDDQASDSNDLCHLYCPQDTTDLGTGQVLS